MWQIFIVSQPVFVPEYVSLYQSLSHLLLHTMHTYLRPSSRQKCFSLLHLCHLPIPFSHTSSFPAFSLSLPSFHISICLSRICPASFFICTHIDLFSLTLSPFSVLLFRVFGCRKRLSIMNIIQIPSGCACEHGQGQSQ